MRTVIDKFVEVNVKNFQKYEMVLEALRRHEGFRKDTDEAFSRFWKSIKVIRGRDIPYDISDAELYKQASLAPEIINDYCISEEALSVARKYGLHSTFHYNQEDNYAGFNAIIFPKESRMYIDDKSIWKVQSHCLSAVAYLHKDLMEVTINLDWPKQAIMQLIEAVLDKALWERAFEGKKTKKRGMTIDMQPFRVWDLHKKEGKGFKQITYELYPDIQGKSFDEAKDNFSGIARSRLAEVVRAFKKAEKLISSITPAVQE